MAFPILKHTAIWDYDISGFFCFDEGSKKSNGAYSGSFFVCQNIGVTCLSVLGFVCFNENSNNTSCIWGRGDRVYLIQVKIAFCFRLGGKYLSVVR